MTSIVQNLCADDLSPTGNSADLRIHVLTTIQHLEKLRPKWESLLLHYSQTSTFSTLEWLIPWWREFGEGLKLYVVAIEDSASNLIGMAPFSLGTRKILGKEWKVLALMGDGSGDSDNLDLPVRPGFEKQFISILLNHLKNIQGADNQWDFCELNLMPRGAVGEIHILPELRDLKWPHQISEYPKRIIDLPETWEAYLKGLSQNERRNILRYRKRLEAKYKVEVLHCARPDELPIALESFFDLHQKAWVSRGEQGTFQSMQRRRFYLELSKNLLERQQLEFWLLHLDGQLVAAEFDFRYRTTVYALQQAFAQDRNEDRAGGVLRGYVLERLIGSGVRQYDFLGGEDAYKERWYPRKDSYINIRFARPFTAGSLLLRTMTSAKRSKAWLRATLPMRAWHVLHNFNKRMSGKAEGKI